MEILSKFSKYFFATANSIMKKQDNELPLSCRAFLKNFLQVKFTLFAGKDHFCQQGDLRGEHRNLSCV